MKRSLVLILPLVLAACAGGRGSWNGSVQCAPYAREHSAINLRGAAASWWGEAQ
ncbi:CHAP domain-containing protein, partial [Acetobacter sp. DmW_125124]